MMHRYIRSKTNPDEILAFGYVDAGGLGEFDTEHYEEIEGELPQQWTRLTTANPQDPFVAALDAVSDPDDQLVLLRLRAVYEQAVLLRLPQAIQAIETQLSLLIEPLTSDVPEAK